MKGPDPGLALIMEVVSSLGLSFSVWKYRGPRQCLSFALWGTRTPENSANSWPKALEKGPGHLQKNACVIS